MIIGRGAVSMKSAALPQDANDDTTFRDMTGHSSHNSNDNNHYGNSRNISNISEATMWSKASELQASSAKTAPVLRNINNDMTKALSRKSYQWKMQYTSGDLDGKQANDDLRMSKIMRRLQSETSPAAALELCAKLELAVRTPINTNYLARSFNSILDGMLALLKQCTPPVLEECSKTLGLIGYINRMSYPIYEEFIVKNYRAHKRLQRYLIVALQTTLCCDTDYDLHIYAEKIMLMLKDFLDSADSIENFMGISTCIVQFSFNYRDAFACHFTDVVDIIIGWQLEIGQPKQLKSHCAYVLEQLTPYFSKQLEFSYGLLTQFVEDITALDATERPGERLGAFVGAFNSLLKCLSRMHITCESIVSHALKHLNKQMLDALLIDDTNSDAVININELLCICLLNGYSEPEAATLAQLLTKQFQHIHEFSEPQQLSCLYLLLCTVRKLRARLPVVLVQLIFQTDAREQPFLAGIRLQSEGKAHKLLLRSCQETLLIKNVPLLQQAYKQLVQDIENCVQQLAHAEEQQLLPNEVNNASLMLIFHLSTLAALGKQTSSIIGMYACKPSILELLVTNCCAQELSMWSKHAATYHAVLSLLVVHCQANHNFRNNSNLLRDEDNDVVASCCTSPTAHSFGQILKFLAFCLSQAAQLAPLNLKLLLAWTHALLDECRTHAHTLLQHADFISICESIAGISAKCAPLESARCIQAVLRYGSATLSLPLLQLYRETALHQLQSLDSCAHSAYAEIYAQLPISLSIERRGALGFASSHFSVWQQRLSQFTAVHDSVFRDFFELLRVPEQQQFTDCLRSLFTRSCQLMALDERQEKLALCTKRCQRLGVAWLQFEAARYCVDQKLRTALGKPQDTFLAFEAIVMRYARLLSGCAKRAERQTLDDMSHQELSNTRANLGMLLGFLDVLEKLIYNAAEGSAFALRPPDKPVNAFFRLNNPTCQSWFNRIRIGVVIIAMHSQQPELVIRYAQGILRTQKTQDCTYNQAIIYLAWAFIRCGESDSLRGLYIWARSKCDKSYQWLQHAAEQAAGRRELAAVGYKSLLAAEEQATELEPNTRQFVISQLIECMQSTGQWTQLVELKMQLKLTEDNSPQLNPFMQKSSMDLSGLEQLLAKSVVTTDELSAALHKLSLWPSESAEHASFAANYTLDHLQYRVLQQALNKNGSYALDASMQELLDTNWRETLLNASCDQADWQELTLLKHISQNLANQQEQLVLLPLNNNYNNNNNNKCNSSSLSSAVLLRCVAWTELLRSHCDLESLDKLYLDTAMLAREEGNLQTCQAMLELYFGQGLAETAAQLLTQQLNTSNDQVLRGYSELAKCLHLQQQQQQQQLQTSELSSFNIVATLCLSIQQQQQQEEQRQQQLQLGSAIGAELLLTLSEWITARSCSGLATNLSPTLQQLLEQLPECPLTRTTSAQPMALPHGERLVARLINASLQQRPNNEEALIAYGNWCYRWGKKIVDCGCVLTQTDVSAIGLALGGKQPLDGETLQELLQALRMEHQPGNNCEEDELQTDDQCENRLRRLKLLSEKPASVLEEIISIWRRAISNTFDYYREAARAYFHYLSLKADNGQHNLGLAAQQQRFQVDDNNMVTTTLRLLRLIVKHASGLQEVLEQGLKTTPIGPWKMIIPQLFSRLNHHEPYVRKSVCALLCRLAESRPQLVTFPAVVGAMQELQATPISTVPAVDTTGSSSSSFACLLGDLTKQAPEVVQHVQLLVKELRRVCLLWDEYWLHSLAHINNSYVGRVNALASEVKPDDHEGKQNRFDSLRPQLLNDLEALMAFTSREPETSYERNFKRRFDAPIKATLDALRQQPYPDAWNKLKQLYHVLQSNMLRGTSNTLKMQSISPVLCAIGRMCISMPGLDAQNEQQPVHIESVESLVYILPTKTKPKKVAFYGSNGQKYTFLFKGLEDLHLDERIMQFLSISNAIMATKNDTPHSCYRAHHYSVIPLGPQSGLISWVDGVTPLFALYKKWQQRQPQTATAAPTRRLTDLFYNKLAPLLAKHNMVVTDPRRLWPLSALQQVLAELIQETPADLLARELWCQAGCAAEWRQSVRRYTMCMAVMSVIGYVIGLGDRHLDNVLINLTTGDIVHIDYNDCFEKGRTLRIPERVPFRLTQNMVHALGITGIEGAFRLGCEYVLKVMRKERETLLTLLEAFVYDPLVDWTVNDDTAALRRAINAKPSDSVSSEMKSLKKDKSKNKLQDWDAKRRHLVGKLKQCQKFWNKYKVDLMPQLLEMGKEFKKLQQIQSQRLSSEQELIDLNQRSALISEINSLGTAIESHSFNTASMRYATKRQHAQVLASQAELLKADYEQMQCLLASYGQCVQQQALANFNMRLIQFKIEGNSWHNEYLALVDMQLNLPAQILEGYNSVRNQSDELFGRLNDLGLQCVEHMQQYAAIMFYYPEQRHRENINVKFHDSYANYLQNGQTASTSYGSAINPEHKLLTAKTLQSVWMQLSCQLDQLNQHFANEQAIAQTITPSHSLLAVISQCGCSQSMLNAALIRTLDSATNVFSDYEQSALEAQDVKLLHQQMQFTQLIRTICQSIAEPVEQANDQLNELQTALAALAKLQHCFENELPATMFRLLLLNPNMTHLESLLTLSTDALAERYASAISQHKKQLQQQQPQLQTQQIPPLNVEQQFLLFLQPAYAQFEQLSTSLHLIAHNIKLLIDDVHDAQTQQYMELNILKNGSSQLKSSVFFELVLQTLRSCSSYDVRVMGRPVRDFVHLVQTQHIVGLVVLLSHGYYSSCRTRCQEQGIGDCPQDVGQLCDGLFAALQAEALLQQQQCEIALLSQQIETQTLIASAHYWAYGDLLGSELSCGHIISRQKLCAAIYENWQTLDENSAAMQRLQQQLIGQLEQLKSHRSNWNRNHIDSLLRNDQLQGQLSASQLEIVHELGKCATAICRIEQTDVGKGQQQQQHQKMIEQWLHAYALWQASNAKISNVEQAIIQLLDPEGPIDQCYVTNVQGLLEDYTCKVQREISYLECEQQNRHEILCSLFKSIQRHQEHMPRIYTRNLCPEADDESQGKLMPMDVQLLCGHVRASHRILGNFFQRLLDLRKEVVTERQLLLPATLSDWQQQLQHIQQMVSQDVDEFFSSVEDFFQHAGDNDMLPYETFTHNKGSGNQHEQKRNAYGVSVWKKIRMKLEGRDPDSNQRSTVAEQVDYVIREATNPDNLAVLYEGWTPWV